MILLVVFRADATVSSINTLKRHYVTYTFAYITTAILSSRHDFLLLAYDAKLLLRRGLNSLQISVPNLNRSDRSR